MSTIGDVYGPIIGVAVIYDNVIWVLPKPNRHHHVLRTIAKANGVGIAGPDVQGFIDSNGTFLDRETALMVAKYHNQLITNDTRANQLFSEDLW